MWQPTRVLLIEDDDPTREMLATALRGNGYVVRAAADGLHGLRILEMTDVDVIVLDMRLPLASGFEVLHEVRASHRTRRMPVIVMSADPRAIELASGDREVFTTLVKPFDPEDLVDAVRRALRSQRG